MKGFFDNYDEMKFWKKEWQGMPEFIQNDLTPLHSITVNFESKKDLKDFSKLIKQKITLKTKSLWFPKVERENLLNKICTDEN